MKLTGTYYQQSDTKVTNENGIRLPGKQFKLGQFRTFQCCCRSVIRDTNAKERQRVLIFGTYLCDSLVKEDLG